jgi:hypothetical protein
MNEVYAFLSWQFFAYWLLFFIAFFVSFIIPGLVLMHKTTLSTVQRTLIAPILGIAMWAVQGFVFGWLATRALTYLYLLTFIFLFFKLFFPNFKRFFNLYKNRSIYIKKIGNLLPPVGWIILSLGSLLQLSAVFGSGFANLQGISFYWLNAFDGMLHLAFIEALVQNFPPIQPGAWPLPITNYHYWSNLVMAELVRIWHLPTNHLFFHYLPVYLAPLLGGVIFTLVKQWTKSTTAALWALFLHYFSGDLMYVFLWWWHRTLGEHTLTMDNGIIQLLNMPQAFAKLLFMGGLLLFDVWQKKKQWLSGLLAGLLLATTVGFKVYFGFFTAFGLAWFTLTNLIKTWRKYFIGKNAWASIRQIIWLNRQELSVLALVGVVSALIFLPVNHGAGGLFWAPLDWPKLLLGQGKLDWNEWWLRMQVYQAANSIKGIIAWQAIALTVFMIAVYGTRLLGFFFPRRIAKKIGWHNFWFLYPGTLVFTFIGLNFLQVSGGHNIFNFFVIALSSLTLLTAVVLADVVPKNAVGKTLALIFIVATVPRVFLTGWYYLSRYANSWDAQTVSRSDLEAFDFLATNPQAVLLQTHPKNFLDDYAPMTFFFTGKYSYYGGRNVLQSHNQPIQDRITLVNRLFNTKNPHEVEGLLQQAGITHLIFQYNDPAQLQWFPLTDEKNPLKMKLVFTNDEIRILEYLPE